jgi:glycine/D-amino acid oxidase-like deaminating enzyme
MTDLIVVGGGTMGAWTALHAARAGRRTTLVDAFGPGHSRATSGDETRIIRASHGADAFYTRWSRAAREAWIALGEEAGERLFLEAGALWFAHREDGFEAASLATLEAAGIPVERLSPDEIEARWPQVRAAGLAFGVFEPEAGMLMARRGVMAAARAFGRAGGRFELASVRPGEQAGGRLVDLVGEDGVRIAGDTFVFAAGPWLPQLFPDAVGELIRVTKQDVLFVGPPPGDGRFAAEWQPAWVDYDAAFYGIPAVDGRGFKLAPDRYGPPFDPSAGERIVDPDAVREARRFLRRRFPDLADQPVVETRVCQYEATPDTHFVIDRHPELENVWLVGGGSGHGFKHGPEIGRHVNALLDGHQPIGDEVRFGLAHPRAATPGLRTGAASVAGSPGD